MSLSASARRHHAIYEALPLIHRCLIDDAYTAMRRSMVESCPTLTLAGDDRAEECVSAITRYLIESNPDDPAIKAAIAEVDR